MVFHAARDCRLKQRRSVHVHRLTLCLLMTSIILTACGNPDSDSSAVPVEPRSPRAPQRTLVIVANQVPVDLAAKGLAGGAGAGTGVAENVPSTILNATLG